MKTLSDDQLAVAIPKAFPELFQQNLQHRWRSYPVKGVTCKKCDLKWKKQIGPCTVPAPIVIDWNVAMKVFREGCATTTMRARALNQLREIWRQSEAEAYSTLWTWTAGYATPADYLRAALEAVKGVE
ncbi:hypothetical protein LCGC14_1543180 [marine sediment metagenome]|uniref:Uncharacterized protein n=1 Tax=marine sediment metagenome TaxID=412755 RepID=A0A0F9LTA2_9ZZZZ|nr:hypothetical protein [Phycisphaerales bacterium]